MAKHLLNKVGTENGAVAHALQELRNTPRAEGFSPAQLMFSKRQRTAVPCHEKAYDAIELEQADAARRKVRHKDHYDKDSVVLRELTQGEPVIVQNIKTNRWDITGHVSESYHGGRRYEIQMTDGYTITCNRHRVRPDSANSNHIPAPFAV